MILLKSMQYICKGPEENYAMQQIYLGTTEVKFRAGNLHAHVQSKILFVCESV